MLALALVLAGRKPLRHGVGRKSGMVQYIHACTVCMCMYVCMLREKKMSSSLVHPHPHR